MNWPNKEHRASFLVAAAGTPAETAIRALLHRIDELEREPRPVQVKLTKADVEEAALSLFTLSEHVRTDAALALVNPDGQRLNSLESCRTFIETVAALCESFGVPE